jgi:NAD(P)-dependent dehydrogenase (short-subunit alcohol dehydrogenase family)
MNERTKVAVVTDAGQGIGRARAIGLLQAGWHTVFAGRTRQKLEAAIAYAGSVPGQSLAVTCDVSKVQDIEQLFAPMLTTFGRVDLLFNNVCRSMAVPSILRAVSSISATCRPTSTCSS